jgi:hypothetical protein
MFGLEALTAAIGAYMKPQYQEKALQAVTFGAAL